jgi:pimeloyl-ACP methyl ester carboxylesterase
MLRLLIFFALAAAAASTLSTPLASVAAAKPARAEAPAAARFSVTVEGKGPDLILIPGLMSGREVWDDSVASLGGRYRVHRVQLSGFAGEPARGNGSGAILDGVVEQLDAYIKANRLRRPAIAGHSMGGLLAMMLAARHPDSVGRVLVVDALPFYSLLFGPDATVAAVTPRAASFRDSIIAMDEAAWRAQQPRTMAALVKTEAARPRIIADAEASDRSVAARAVYEVMTTDARPLLPAIKAPLTIAYATNEYGSEAMVGPIYRGAYAGAPRARLVQVDGSYHFVMIDQPERFRALLAEFLAAGR